MISLSALTPDTGLHLIFHEAGRCAYQDRTAEGGACRQAWEATLTAATAGIVLAPVPDQIALAQDAFHMGWQLGQCVQELAQVAPEVQPLCEQVTATAATLAPRTAAQPVRPYTPVANLRSTSSRRATHLAA